LPLIK